MTPEPEVGICGEGSLVGHLPSFVGRSVLKPEGSRLTAGGWHQNYKRSQFQSLVRGLDPHMP